MHFENCVKLLNDRGIDLDDIVECVQFLISKFQIKTDQEVKAIVESILKKREVQNAVLTGIELDILTESDRLLSKELSVLLKNDESLYGVDEVLAYGICNLYGSIALTNFGYIDRVKPGIIGRLNDDKSKCNTFLDDIVGAIAASAASKIAHI